MTEEDRQEESKSHENYYSLRDDIAIAIDEMGGDDLSIAMMQDTVLYFMSRGYGEGYKAGYESGLQAGQASPEVLDIIARAAFATEEEGDEDSDGDDLPDEDIGQGAPHKPQGGGGEGALASTSGDDERKKEKKDDEGKKASRFLLATGRSDITL